MIGRNLSFVFLLIFLPSIVQALKCSYDGTCQLVNKKLIFNPPKLNAYKNCNESCVFFYCFNIYGKYVKHGYGCREDFERLCPHASIKEYNMNNYTDGKDFLIFSCNDSNYCANIKSISFTKNLTLRNVTLDLYADEKCVYDEDEESILASGDVFFEEPYYKTYIAFFVCFIVIFFGPYVYYEIVIG